MSHSSWPSSSDHAGLTLTCVMTTHVLSRPNWRASRRMTDLAARIAFVIRGVVRQAMNDAGETHARLVHEPSAQSALIEQWCALRFSGHGLAINAANKTELLLGTAAPAAVLPLGDLYASEVAAFCGSCELSPAVQELAEVAGGLEPLDEALRRLLDERRDPDAAFRHIPALREPVLRRLQQTRFRRAQSGIVPKLGARTNGIDLFI